MCIFLVWTDQTGNKGLCGKPLKACKPSISKKRTILIICTVAGTTLALAAIVAISCTRGNRSKTSELIVDNKTQETKTLKKYGANYDDMGQNEIQSSDCYFVNSLKGENGKLHFVNNDRERFELNDLLRASAEVLGSSSFGSSYKAVLLTGPAMVVKRFRQMSNVGKEDFHEHMTRLGSLSHPNLLPLIAFYYRNEEKLLVSDFVPNGSLANLLHGMYVCMHACIYNIIYYIIYNIDVRPQ